jgi:N-acetylglucosamine malate deacetylase 1
VGPINRIKSLVKRYVTTRRSYRFFVKNWFELGDLSVASEILATMRQQVLLTPVKMDGVGAKKILILAPHPDDEIMGPGGTMIKALEQGAEVLVLYLTRGAEGESGDKVTEEAIEVSKALGYRTAFLDYRAGKIDIGEESAMSVAKIVQEFDPEAIFLPFFLDDHDDHRCASHLLLNAFDRSLKAVQAEVWAYQVYGMVPANVVVEISNVVDQKADAIRMFSSQSSVRDWVNWSLGLNAFNSRWLKGNTGKPRYAEMFFVLPCSAYIDLCRTYFHADPPVAYYGKNYLSQTGNSDGS